MQTNNIRRRANRSALLALAAVAALVMGTGAAIWSAPPASAHNYPVAYAPAEGAVVTEQPGTVSVTTNDNLLQLKDAGAGMGLQVTGPGGTPHPLYYGDGCVTVFGPTLEAVAQLGQPGVYTVIWQVVSTDGHPVSGEYNFTWQPAAGQPLATGSPTPPDCNGTMTTQAMPVATSSTDAAGGDGQTPAEQGASAMMSELLWVGGAFVAVVIAVLAALFLVRRKPGEPGPLNNPGRPAGPSEPEDPAKPGDPR